MKKFDLDAILKKSDELFEKKDATAILSHINSIKNFLNEDIELIKKAQLAYSIGTSFEDVITLNKDNPKFDFEKYLEKALYYFDYAFDNMGNEPPKALYEQLLTNYANACRSCGRTIKAIEMYNKIKYFPMSQGNLGVTLSHFAPVQYDEVHKGLLFKEGYKQIKDALKSKDYLKLHGADEVFENELKRIEQIVRIEYLNSKNKFKKYNWGKSKTEKIYRKWLAENGLYLNVLNDIYKDSFVAYDFLHLPSMLYNIDNTRDEFDCAIMNQIKQEYVSARYRLFESLNYIERKNHIADKDVELYELTNNLMSCNYYENLTRCCFKDFYSILDRIAYFVNQYFNLNLDLTDVSFRKVMENKVIKEVAKNNLMINGLYWSSKDIFEDKYQTTKYKSKNYAKLRNYLEHRLVVTTINTDNIKINENEIFISQYELFKYTFDLMKIVRECIIYLILGINVEEKKKPKDKEIINLTRIKMSDDLK